MKKRNQIDKLFSEGLSPDKDPIPYNQEDWRLLEQRLDAKDRRNRMIFLFKTVSGVAAVLLLAFFWWILSPEKRTPNIQETAIKKDLPQVKSPEEITPLLDQQRMEQFVELKTSSQWASGKPVVEQSIERETLLFSDLAFNPKIRFLDSLPSAERQIASTDWRAIRPQPSLAQSESESDKQSLSYGKARKVELSILAAPALNGVNSFNRAKVGSDLGLMLTVVLSNKLSVSTGAVYAKKVYETGFDNYNPAGDIWFKYNPKEVYADCRVLDIPLNLNYEVIKQGKNTVTLGTGLSSYIMLKEDYHFVYNKPSNDLQDVHLVNENKHWLSVVNLEASFERQLNDKVAVSVQPYMKIPISDIGFARVKLQSVGMAVNVKVNLHKNK